MDLNNNVVRLIIHLDGRLILHFFLTNSNNLSTQIKLNLFILAKQVSCQKIVLTDIFGALNTFLKYK